MEPTTTSDPTCFRCERSALTFDDKHRPLCGRHATIFLSEIRASMANRSARSSEEASVKEESHEAEEQNRGFHLRLVPAPGSGPDADDDEPHARGMDTESGDDD